MKELETKTLRMKRAEGSVQETGGRAPSLKTVRSPAEAKMPMVPGNWAKPGRSSIS